MKRTIAKYYRIYNEDFEGNVGHYCCEVEASLIVRQIIETEKGLYWSTLCGYKDERYDFTDQPEFPESEIPKLKAELELKELTKTEFEILWKKAHEQA